MHIGSYIVLSTTTTTNKKKIRIDVIAVLT